MRKPPIHISFFNASRGLWMIIKSERNFQIHACALVLNCMMMGILPVKTLDVIAILSVCFLVLITEIFNTAIEKLCDYVQPDYDKKIGFIKDICAGAVTLMSVLAVIVGVFVYKKYLF